METDLAGFAFAAPLRNFLGCNLFSAEEERRKVGPRRRARRQSEPGRQSWGLPARLFAPPRGPGGAHGGGGARTASQAARASGGGAHGRSAGGARGRGSLSREGTSCARLPSSGARPPHPRPAGAARRPPGGAGLRRSRTPGPRALCPPAREALAELRPRSRGRARRPRPAPTPWRVSSGKGGGVGGSQTSGPDPHPTPCRENWGELLSLSAAALGFGDLRTSD